MYNKKLFDKQTNCEQNIINKLQNCVNKIKFK